MKLWRLLDDDGTEIASVPFDEILDPELCAAGRDGYGIYEAVSVSGHVIYTGRTSDLANRLRSHATQSPWWGFAVEIRWMPVENYGEAVALERVGITTDQGDWNIQGRRELSTAGRQSVPAAMHCRLAALYAAADTMGKSADLDNYIHTARTLGWTLQSMADVLCITREAVRQRAIKGTVDHDLVIPNAPSVLRPSKARKVWPTICEADRQEMRRLYELAALVRGLTAIDHPNRIASERLTEMIADAKLRGVRVREIAEVLGVSIEAIQKRLQRHGYMKNSPSQSDYRPGSGFGQRRGRTQSACSKNHPGVPREVRFINGDPSRPTCRECERARVAKYQAKKPYRMHPIREWAMQNGVPVPPRGRVPASVRRAYEDAHGKAAA